MRRSVLALAQQIELRARIAHMLSRLATQSSSGEPEARTRAGLGGKSKRQSFSTRRLVPELCDKIPKTSVLGHRTDETLRRTRL
jgi:hypothetical protein